MLALLCARCTDTPSAISSRGGTFALSLASSQGASTTTSLEKKSCGLSKTKRGLRIAGATLLGVGAASLITGGVLWSLHEQPKEGWCSYRGELQPYCLWNTKLGGGIAMGLGSAGMLAGGFMLGYSFIPGKSDDSCK